MKSLLLILLAYAGCVSADQPSSSTAEAVAHAAKTKNYGLRSFGDNHTELLIVEPFGISRVDIDTHSRRMVIRTSFVGGIDYHLVTDRIYWSDVSTGRIYSRRLRSRAGSAYSIETVVDRSPLFWRPRSLAVDYVANKIYVVDSRGKKVHVFELDGNHHSVIFNGDLRDPMDIAVDPMEGLMFVADGNRIIKINMDGTSPVEIVTYRKYNIKSVALDLAHKRVYWSDATFHRIKSARYDGTDLAIVLKNERGKAYSLLGPADLAFHEGRLYFYDDMWRKVSSVEVNDLGRADESTYQVVYDKIDVDAMRVVYPTTHVKYQLELSNPCKENNGQCQQLCLLAGKNKESGAMSHSCACNSTVSLANDGRSCH